MRTIIVNKKPQARNGQGYINLSWPKIASNPIIHSDPCNMYPRTHSKQIDSLPVHLEQGLKQDSQDKFLLSA